VISDIVELSLADLIEQESTFARFESIDRDFEESDEE
jgi:hypothetical protein